jgi:hypothetical protein
MYWLNFHTRVFDLMLRGIIIVADCIGHIARRARARLGSGLEEGKHASKKGATRRS